MASILNKSAVKKAALDAAEKLRPAVGFTRVSREFINRMESILLNRIRAEVQALPSVGKTIK